MRREFAAGRPVAAGRTPAPLGKYGRKATRPGESASAQIPSDANYIFFGVFLNGRGQIELRNPQLEPHPASQQQPGKSQEH